MTDKKLKLIRKNINGKIDKKSNDNVKRMKKEQDDFDNGRSCYDPRTGNLRDIKKISAVKLNGKNEPDKYVVVANSKRNNVTLVKMATSKNKTAPTGTESFSRRGVEQRVDTKAYNYENNNRYRTHLKNNHLTDTRFKNNDTTIKVIKKVCKKEKNQKKR